MKQLGDLRVKIFADGADAETMLSMNSTSHIRGLTTNPTLMRKAGVSDYREFAHYILEHVTEKPISFEVFSDEIPEMETQAREISTWGHNVYVKIPITNTRGESTAKLIAKLADSGVKVNVTALFAPPQVEGVAASLQSEVPSFISVFAGRIADTGRDPIPMMLESLAIIRPMKTCQLIWASPREVFNVIQADEIGCHIITATPDILSKLTLLGLDLLAYSLDTVQMFRNDAIAAGYQL